MSKSGVTNYWARKLSATPIQATPPLLNVQSVVRDAEPVSTPVSTPETPKVPKKRGRPPKIPAPVEVPGPFGGVLSVKKIGRDIAGQMDRFADGTRKPKPSGYPSQNRTKRCARRDEKLPKTPATVLETPATDPQVMTAFRASYQIESEKNTILSKSVCTIVVAERMALLVASGISQVVAAAAMGISYEQLTSWNDRGRKDIERGLETDYSHWWTKMLMAKASCEANWVARLNEGALSDWRAAAFMLERRFGVRWALRSSKELLPGPKDLAGKSTEELKAMLQRLMVGPGPERTVTNLSAGERDVRLAEEKAAGGTSIVKRTPVVHPRYGKDADGKRVKLPAGSAEELEARIGHGYPGGKGSNGTQGILQGEGKPPYAGGT
jgi:hypothetical protein